MKKLIKNFFSVTLLLGVVVSFSTNYSMAQNVSINVGGAAPDSSAMLDVSARDKGILIPRMTSAQRIGITNPANGLIVYQTDALSGIYIYNSGSNLWQRLSYDSSNNLAAVLAQGSNANVDTIYNLGLLGVGVNNNLLNPLNVKGPAAFIDDSLNSVGRPSASHITLYPRSFANYIESGIGTTPTRLVFQSESYSFTTGVTNFGDVGTVLQITNSGDIGIGTFTPSAKLEVAGDGSLIGGLRVSGTTSATVGASIYLNGASKDWTITATNSSAGAGTDKLVFRDYSSATDRMTIDNLGNVGIGTTNPSSKLEVVGDIEIPVTSNYTYSSPKIHYQSFAPTVFNSITPDLYEFGTNIAADWYGYFRSGGTAFGYATVQVNLPDGAVVTELRGWIFDNVTTNPVRVQLIRQQLGSSAIANMATIESDVATAINAVQNLVETNIFNATIDNANYAYFLIFTGLQNSQDTRLYGSRITFTVTEVD